MVVFVALGAALCYAAAMVLQQTSAREVDASASLRPRLLLTLMGEPLWLLGVAANVAGYGLRFLALGRGSLVVVQPVLVSGLLFALPLGAVATRRALERREWTGALQIVAGLSLFLLAASPSRGRASAPATSWLSLGLLLGVPVLVLVVVARRRPDSQRAALLAAAGGILFTIVAALSKTSAVLARHGVSHLVANWAPYALILVGVVAVLLVQSAFQAGPLSASLPALSVTEPLVSIAAGSWLFHERVASDPAAFLVEVVGLGLAVAGILTVAASPIVAGMPQVEEA